MLVRLLSSAVITLLLLASVAWAGVKEDYEAAGEAHKRGENDLALQLYEKVVKSGGAPKEALYRAYHFMGAIHLERKNWKEAYANFATSVKIEPGNALAHAGMGRAWAGEGMWRDAVDEYSLAIQLKPDLAIAYMQRAFAYKELGEAQKAEADVKRARELKAASEGGAPGGAQAAAPSPDKEPATAEEFFQRGNLWGRQGQLDKALADMDQAIRLKPDYTHAHFNRAMTLALMGRLPEAVAGYSKVLELDPGYLPVYNDRGRLLLKMGQIKEAMADFERAVDQNVDKRLKAYGLHNRGNTRMAMGQHLAAVEDYTQAMSLGYKPWDLYMARGEAYRLARQYDKALEDYQQVKQLKPGLADPHAFSALALAYLERYPQALAEVEQAIKLQPKDKILLGVRGNIYFLDGRFAEAARDLEAAGPGLSPVKGSHLPWIYVARERAGQPSREWLAEQAQGLDLARWPGVIIDLFLGKATPQDVNGQAVTSTRELEVAQRQQNQGYFFLAQYYLLRGIPIDARINLEHCIRRDLADSMEYQAAKAELKRMGPAEEKKKGKSKKKAE